MPPKRKAALESDNASKRPKSTRKAASQATQAVASLLAATSSWEDGDDRGFPDTARGKGGAPATARQKGEGKKGGGPEAARQEGGGSAAARQEGEGSAAVQQEGGGSATARQEGGGPAAAPKEGGGGAGVEKICFKTLPREEHKMQVHLPSNCNPAAMSAVDWFELFWTEDDWESLVNNTNAYAQK